MSIHPTPLRSLSPCSERPPGTRAQRYSSDRSAPAEVPLPNCVVNVNRSSSPFASPYSRRGNTPVLSKFATGTFMIEMTQRSRTPVRRRALLAANTRSVLQLRFYPTGTSMPNAPVGVEPSRVTVGAFSCHRTRDDVPGCPRSVHPTTPDRHPRHTSPARRTRPPAGEATSDRDPEMRSSSLLFRSIASPRTVTGSRGRPASAAIAINDHKPSIPAETRIPIPIS